MHARSRLDKHLNKGYTLMEMVVVLAILSMCLIGGATGYRGIRHYQLHTVVMAMEELVYHAQHTAHLENKLTVVQVNGQSLQWLESGFVIGEVPFLRKMQVTLTTEEEKLRFNKDLAPKKGATILIQDDVLRKIKRLTIRPVTGKITRYDEP